jgi:hypothetical protein
MNPLEFFGIKKTMGSVRKDLVVNQFKAESKPDEPLTGLFHNADASICVIIFNCLEMGGNPGLESTKITLRSDWKQVGPVMMALPAAGPVGMFPSAFEGALVIECSLAGAPITGIRVLT